MDWTAIAVTIALAVVVPYGLRLAQRAVDAYVKDARLRQWATGVISAAGKAYTALLVLREAQPATPIGTLVQTVVKDQADALMKSYTQTAAAIGATPEDGHSAVLGKLGGLLAADPTVTVAVAEIPGPAPRPLDPVPVTPTARLQFPLPPPGHAV